MSAEIITKEDLNSFRLELLQEIKDLLSNNAPKQKEWLKSPEVRKLLKISPGTLQNLRINGTIRYTRLGSIIYYREDDIQKLLEEGMKE
jgi:hypothetical protein